MNWSRVLRTAWRILDESGVLTRSTEQQLKNRPSTRGRGPSRPGRGAQPSGGYLGDFRGTVPAFTYSPDRNGAGDPGEIVWAWVPFEEDHTQGKDRPVLLLGTAPGAPDVFLALPLTSKDHDRDAAQERAAGREWMDIGSGPWDRSGRPSEVRLNRILQLRAGDIRREGAALDEATFGRVVDAVRAHQ